MMSKVILGFFLLLWSIPAVAMEDRSFVVLQQLDKTTARVSKIEIPVGKTVASGHLDITVRVCRQSSATEAPESAAFLEIDEHVIGQQETKKIFSGWMFASSPALSALDHPLYDVWVLDCGPHPEAALPKKKQSQKPDKPAPAEEAPPSEDLSD